MDAAGHFGRGGKGIDRIRVRPNRLSYRTVPVRLLGGIPTKSGAGPEGPAPLRKLVFYFFQPTVVQSTVSNWAAP